MFISYKDNAWHIEIPQQEINAEYWLNIEITINILILVPEENFSTLYSHSSCFSDDVNFKYSLK